MKIFVFSALILATIAASLICLLSSICAIGFAASSAKDAITFGIVALVALAAAIGVVKLMRRLGESV